MTSFSFFIIFILSLVIYYVIPKRLQWVALLIYSIIYFIFSCKAWTILYLVISITSTWAVCKLIYDHKDDWSSKKLKLWMMGGLIVNLGILFLLKYLNFFISDINWILICFHKQEIPLTSWESPIGISFYTLLTIAYILDVYWGITEPEERYFKTALFIGYWPQLLSGPITRHNDMKGQLFSGHDFLWQNVSFGLQRMLWGVFKSVVLSSRLKIMVDTIYGDTIRYNGLYIWTAAVLFLLQLYTDFSGCMDIVIGASECYGIILPENFRMPFFSRTVQEYWQRWHITLGGFMRDYVLNPLLRSRILIKQAEAIKSRYGRKASIQIPSDLAMLVVWLLMGLWHGGDWKYILGMGLWFWGCIVLSRLFTPLLKKMLRAARIKQDVFSWHLFQSLWVFFLAAIGNMFFRIDSFKEALRTIKRGLINWNPWILYDGSLYSLGVSEKEVRVVLTGLVIMLAISFAEEKGKGVREMIAKQNYIFRWGIYILLICTIIVYGTYGPGYDAQTFIYGNF